MPQLLKIEVEGELVAWLSTYNKGGTIYDVILCVAEIGATFRLPDVDTGVQRQPQGDQARCEDFKDDFAHARRCVAAALASSNRFLQLLRKQGSLEYAEIRPITIRLMTNRYDRGLVQVDPIERELVYVVAAIGVGDNRVPNSLPKSKCEFAFEGLDISGALTHTERALKVLHSIGPSLLQSLEARASH